VLGRAKGESKEKEEIGLEGVMGGGRRATFDVEGEACEALEGRGSKAGGRRGTEVFGGAGEEGLSGVGGCQSERKRGGSGGSGDGKLGRKKMAWLIGRREDERTGETRGDRRESRCWWVGTCSRSTWLLSSGPICGVMLLLGRARCDRGCGRDGKRRERADLGPA
jgi:hypothetical protein